MRARLLTRFRSAMEGWLLPPALSILMACGSDGTGTPPPPGLVVTITTPTSGAILNYSLTLTAAASAPTGSATVQFKIDGASLGAEVTTPRDVLRVDSYSFTDGPHTVSARARDSTGETAVSPAVAVAIQNPGPNDIVLILSDDQRYDLMGYMPLTDATLTSETVRFDQAVVTTSLRCPSRSSI